jgi:hypothetical protein
MAGEEYFILSGIASLIIAIAVLLGICSLVLKSRSYRYRKYLVNLFIAGKVRQIAEKQKVNIQKEEENFLYYLKKSDDRIKDLDDRIEAETNEEANKA